MTSASSANDGNLRITDRKKDMFIVGGFNAFPAEIEGIMLTHPGVAQVAVVGVPDDRLGEVGAGLRGAPQRRRRRRRRRSSPGAASTWPTTRCRVRSHFVDELPLTASGKVQRFRLRQPGGVTSWRR